MRIAFRKISDSRHALTVTRADASCETIELDSKDFLRHDFTHFAFEIEAKLRSGVWGSIACGGSLDGSEIDGVDVALAERVTGPLQTLVRVGASVEQVANLLAGQVPEIATAELAARIHERLRQIIGHWRAVAYGQEMQLDWPYG